MSGRGLVNDFSARIGMRISVRPVSLVPLHWEGRRAHAL
jgi:hypothetical protein